MGARGPTLWLRRWCPHRPRGDFRCWRPRARRRLGSERRRRIKSVDPCLGHRSRFHDGSVRSPDVRALHIRRCAITRQDGRRLMRVKPLTSFSCPRGCRRKEPLRSGRPSGRLMRESSAVDFESWQGQFRGQFEGIWCSRNSKSVVYLGFSPR